MLLLHHLSEVILVIIGSNLYIHNGGITKNFQQPHTINNISTATTNTNMPGGTRH